MARFINTERCGSYYQDCEVLSDRILFDLEVHGTSLDRAMSKAFQNYKSPFTGRYGYILEYFDHDTATNVIEWVPGERVEI